MKRLLAGLLCALLLFSTACSDRDQKLSARAYSREFAAKLREKLPNARIIVKADLELAIVEGTDHARTAFLDNSYKEYCANPQNKDTIIATYVKGAVDTMVMSDKIDPARIVPVIKDLPWLAEIRRTAAASGAKKEAISEMVSEPLNDQLVIVYAEDSPSNLRYLSAKDLDAAGVKREGLRAVAVENLKKLVKVEARGGKGIYMLVAGGTFETSLLLFDKIWQGHDMQVKGDYVVAIPSRDVLLVTGSGETEVLPKLRAQAREVAAEASYRISPDLFVYRNGRFVKFED